MTLRTDKLPRVFNWLGRTALLALEVLLVLALLLLGLSQTTLVPTSLRAPHLVVTHAADRDDRWRQDLAYLAAELPRLHENAFFRISEADWLEAVQTLDEDIPALEDHVIVVEMTRLVAMLGDGHTHLYGVDRYPTVPLRLDWFGDGLYVVQAAAEHQDAIGSRVVQIGETPIQEAYHAVMPLISTDNEMGLINASPRFLVTPEVLHALGIISEMERVPYVLEKADGTRFALELAPAASASDAVHLVSASDRIPAADPPMYLQNREKFYWYEIVPDQRMVYFQYNVCADALEQSFHDFTNEMFTAIDANSIDLVVVDLRFNGGGNSSVIRPFLQGLADRPDLTEEGHLFAIIGRGTFSSAMMNALDLNDLGGTLIGEPTGGKPNAYGEVRRFRLPNSRLAVQYSTRYFKLLTDSDPESVMSQREVRLNIEDYLNEQDTVLGAILGEVPPEP